MGIPCVGHRTPCHGMTASGKEVEDKEVEEACTSRSSRHKAWAREVAMGTAELGMAKAEAGYSRRSCRRECIQDNGACRPEDVAAGSLDEATNRGQLVAWG
jgi:hypothetical protein